MKRRTGFLLLFLVLGATLSLGACGVREKLVDPHISLDGEVVDALSGAPIAEARIIGQGIAVVAAEDGWFHLTKVLPGAKLSVEADRYYPAFATASSGGPLRLALQPVQLSGTVKNARTGRGIAGATVSLGDRSTQTDAQGAYLLTGIAADAKLKASVVGYESKELDARGLSTFDVELRPNLLKGVVKDAQTGKPVASAKVNAGAGEVLTGPDGVFTLRDLPERPVLVVRAAGFEKARLEIGGELEQDVQLKPLVVKAAYLTYYGVGDKGIRENVFQLLRTTELNAVVIDIKGDYGKIAYKSGVPLVQQLGAQDVSPPIPDVDGLIAYCRANDIYTIARIVAFKDDKLARNGAAVGIDVAAKDRRSGNLVIDREGLGWVDPFRKEVWNYNIAIAKEAAQKGFDEIQFDYIRFPTDFRDGGSYRDVVYSQPNTSENRVKAIAGFLAAAQAELSPLGVFVSVDVFGYTAWQDDDDNLPIGQTLSEIGKYVDFVAPMDYPSTFSFGLPMSPRYVPAAEHPYEIVYYSVLRAIDRLKGTGAKIRPWLQYFDDYTEIGKTYNATEVEAQTRATREAGGTGYMLWDPTNRYNRGGLGP